MQRNFRTFSELPLPAPRHKGIARFRACSSRTRTSSRAPDMLTGVGQRSPALSSRIWEKSAPLPFITSTSDRATPATLQADNGKQALGLHKGLANVLSLSAAGKGEKCGAEFLIHQQEASSSWVRGSFPSNVPIILFLPSSELQVTYIILHFLDSIQDAKHVKLILTAQSADTTQGRYLPKVQFLALFP